MQFDHPLLTAKFQKREKRFFAYCTLEDQEVVAHCPNPGSMRGNLEPGSESWLMDFGAKHLEEGRKLRYKWVAVRSQGTRVVVDTMVANTLVGEALAAGKISELKEYSLIEREKSLFAGSRFDFFLPGDGEKLPAVALEVKSVSMGEGELGLFPDSVTTRGQKHLQELIACKEKGMRAILLFLLMRENGKVVRPARAIDPVYADWLEKAVAAGVEVLVYGIHFMPQGLEVGRAQEFQCQ